MTSSTRPAAPYRAFFEHSNDLLAVLDAEGRFVEANPAWERCLGVGLDRLQGTSMAEHVHPDDRARFETGWHSWNSRPGRPLIVAVRLGHRDGTWRSVETLGLGLLPDRSANAILTITRDVSDRQGADETAAHLAAVVESSDAAILSISEEGTIRTWNRSATSLLGYLPAEAVGHPWRLLVPDELGERPYDLMERVLEGERISNYETLVAHKDGHRVEVSLTLSAVRDAVGLVRGFSAILQDRSRRARRERERAGLLAVAQAATTTHTLSELAQSAVNLLHHKLGYAVTSLYLVDQKTSALRLVAFRGTDRKAVQSASFFPLDAGHPAVAVRAYFQREPIVVDDLPDREDLPDVGAIRRRGLQTLVTLPVLSGDECLGVLQVVTTVRRPPDVMEQATLETIAYNLAAAIRQKQLFDELQETVRELRRANRELDAFAYSASHDLKEPLRSITNFADFLAQDHASELSLDALEKLTRIRNGGLRMHAMLEALLKYSKLGRQLEPDTDVEVEELLQEVREGLDALLRDRRARLDVANPMPRLRSQRARLHEVFSNLITNGVKFNESAAPRVRVSCRSSAEGTTFLIDDNGIGIPSEHRDHLFRLFARLPSGRKFPGTGAGLAIVARCVEQLGGKVWVEDSPLGGARFLFTVPKRAPEPEVALPPVAVPTGEGRAATNP